MNTEMQKLREDMTPEQREAFDALSKMISGQFEKFDWAACAEADMRQKQEAIARNEWVVETKIGADGVSVEISAVIKGSHGHKSWGWHGEHKQIVLTTSKTYGNQLPVSQAMIALAEDEARRICRIKN